MKLDPLETHDRLLHFNKTQAQDISECCQDLIEKRPFGDNPFYIFAHARKDDDGVTTRIIWQPRLTKPKSQTNSMLFKAYPGSDLIKVIWMIPPREMWDQYTKGKMTESEPVSVSIYNFENCRDELDAKEDDDLDDAAIEAIYLSMSRAANAKKLGISI